MSRLVEDIGPGQGLDITHLGRVVAQNRKPESTDQTKVLLRLVLCVRVTNPGSNTNTLLLLKLRGASTHPGSAFASHGV